MRLLALLFYFLSATVAVAAEPDIFNAARDGDVAAIDRYLAAGGDKEARTGRDYTPFILAAYYGQNAALERLQKAGANPCAEDEAGSTAFMGVAFRGHLATAQWLLDHTTCDVNHQNAAGQTALMMASLFGREEIITLLLAHGAKPGIIDQRGNSAASLAKAQGLDKVVKMLTFPLQ